MTELRCPHRKFGELLTLTSDDGVIEVSCRSRWCGRVAADVIVLHRFSTRTGELLETKKYRQPQGGDT